MLSSLLSSFVLLAATVSASPLASRDASAPIAPSKDPWYTAPSGFEQAAPGTVLRVRPAPGNLTQIIGSNCSASYNILFATRDSHFQPSFAVTTVLVPAKGAPAAANYTQALLSYQYPYNSAFVDGSPSYAIYSTPIPDIGQSLGRGWYVSVPDFEGPKASFLAGLTEGRAVLDSVRAAKATPELPLLHDATAALWGYSGGSFASEFAAELQPQYAPELRLAGAAIGGLPDNYTGIVGDVDATPFAGLIPSLLLGVAHQYPSMHAHLLSKLHPSGPRNASAFLRAEHQDVLADFAQYANQSIFEYFQDGIGVLAAPPVAQPLHRESLMGGHGTPQIDLFVYKAVHDELTPISGTDALVERYCAYGARVQYRRNTVGGHVAEITNGAPYAVAFLQGAFAGARLPRGCDVRDVVWNTTTSESLDPASGA